MKYSRLLALTLGTVFLAACGTGESTSTSTLSFPFDAAFKKVTTEGISFSGTAVDGADTWTLALSSAPAADEAFEGVVSKKTNNSLTIKKNGVGATSTFSAYFSFNPFTPKGASYSDGTYLVANGVTGQIPATANVGDSGSVGALTLYSNASKAAVQATQQNTWSLEADTASTAFACINSIIKNAAGAQIGTGAGCYKIDSTGRAIGMRYTITTAGKTLVFK